MSVVLVIAPHPDDEVLGVGGAILAHLSRKDTVHVAICTKGDAAHFGAEQVQKVQTEARAVHKLLGVSGSHFLDLPAARLDTLPGAEIHAALQRVFDATHPDTVYLPHVGDVHRDHQLIFQAGMVCCRPLANRRPLRVLSYETVSETDWYAPPSTPPFIPNVFVDITSFIDRKLEACLAYESQIRSSPDQRSIEGIRALAMTRGHSVGVPYAEAFMLIREVIGT